MQDRQSRIKNAVVGLIPVTAVSATIGLAGTYTPRIGRGSLTCDGPCPTAGVQAVQKMTVAVVVFTVIVVVAWTAVKVAPGKGVQK